MFWFNRKTLVFYALIFEDTHRQNLVKQNRCKVWNDSEVNSDNKIVITMGPCLSCLLGEEKSLNAKIYVGDTVEVISGKYKEQTGIVYSYGKETMKIQFKTETSGNIPVNNVKLIKTNKKKILIRLRKSDKVCNIVGSSKEIPRMGSSWRDFWIIESGKVWPTRCPVCPNSFEKKRSCGAHVFIQGVPFKMQYNIFILMSN